MKLYRRLLYLGILLVMTSFWLGVDGLIQSAQGQSPPSPVKLIFIHHSSGENWLSDQQGGLARALQDNNYFVSDTNYGWGPDSIGDRTDIVNWQEWFRGPRTETYMQALFAEDSVNSPYERILADPGGENRIVMFKSCFPNSDLSGNPDDPPRQEEGLTIANAKFIYNDLLNYFATRPDKLFIVITAPPLINPSQPENARTFNTWLVQDWLDENNYSQNNVVVFDYYNVLTHPENHHRLVNGQVEYVTTNGNDRLYYDTDGDDHANPEGNRKATEEFVPLLNHFYENWIADAPLEPPETLIQIEEETQDVTEQESIDQTHSQVEPGGTIATGMIDDFETTSKSWEAFWQDASQTKITCAPSRDISNSGSQSLLINFDVEPDTWATCELNLEENQDWSMGRGVGFTIHASDAAMVVDVLLFGNDPGARVPYSFRLETTPDMVTGWQEVELTWDMFLQPEYEASPGTPIDPSKVNGLAFAFNTFPDTPSVGKVWVDDLFITGPTSPGPEEAPPAPTEEQLTSPEEEESRNETLEVSRGDEEQSGKGEAGGFCKTPIILIGLVIITAGMLKKRQK